jgi:hypothetical protein
MLLLSRVSEEEDAEVNNPPGRNASRASKLGVPTGSATSGRQYGAGAMDDTGTKKWAEKDSNLRRRQPADFFPAATFVALGPDTAMTT